MEQRKRKLTSNYIDGNTARKLDRQYDYRQKRRQQLKRKPSNREAEHIAMASMSWFTTTLLIASVAVSLFFGYRYLQLVSSVDMHRRNADILSERLNSMIVENDALEKSIDYTIDLEHVYQVAVNELGMVPVNNENIIQYTKTESEYVLQGETIE